MSILVLSSAIPVYSCSIPVDSCPFLWILVPFLWTPVDSSGMGSFLQESVGHGEVLQMCKTKYGINVNNSGGSQSFLIGIWMHDPHACIRMWAIKCWRKPLDKCAREVCALIMEGKEEFDSQGSQSSEAFCALVNSY